MFEIFGDKRGQPGDKWGQIDFVRFLRYTVVNEFLAKHVFGSVFHFVPCFVPILSPDGDIFGKWGFAVFYGLP